MKLYHFFMPYYLFLYIILLFILISVLYLYRFLYTKYSNRVITGDKRERKWVELRFVYRAVLVLIIVLTLFIFFFGRGVEQKLASYKNETIQVMDKEIPFEGEQIGINKLYQVKQLDDGYLIIGEKKNQIVIAKYDQDMNIKWKNEEFQVDTKEHHYVIEKGNNQYIIVLNQTIIYLSNEGKTLSQTDVSNVIIPSPYDIATLFNVNDVKALAHGFLVSGSVKVFVDYGKSIYFPVLILTNEQGVITNYTINESVEGAYTKLFEQDGKIFVGRTDGNLILYNDSLQIEKDIPLGYTIKDIHSIKGNIYTIGYKDDRIYKTKTSYGMISKVNDHGDVLWTKSFGGGKNKFYTFNSVVDLYDKLYVVGGYANFTLTNPQDNVFTDYTYSQMLLVRYSEDGQLELQTHMNQSMGYGVYLDHNELVVFGQTAKDWENKSYFKTFRLDTLENRPTFSFNKDAYEYNVQLKRLYTSYYETETTIKWILGLGTLIGLFIYFIIKSPDELYQLEDEKDFFCYRHKWGGLS